MTNKKGFTLLELLITIAVIAILSVVLVIILNPAETLQKSRDTQRISDLNTMRTAVGLYITTTSTPAISSSTNTTNALCVNGSGNPTLYLSAQNAASGTISVGSLTRAVTSTLASSTLVDGYGWIPIKFTELTGGSPIGQLPIDPTNTAVNGTSTATTYANSALMYRYACNKSPLAFKLAARLESATYGVGGTDDRSSKDGGTNTQLYEAGTDMSITPATDTY